MSKQSMAKQRQWRSLNDLGSTKGFESKTHREFPENADEIEMDGVNRRQFMSITAASAALGGALSGCVRKPAQYILPYAERPEDFLPGESRYFASAVHVGGLVQGVLVESQDGRPTKLEGNPRHAASLGRTNAMVQASVLNMYDPDRSRGAMVDGTPTAVADALHGLPSAGNGTAFLVSGTPSPTLNSLLARAASAGASVYRHGADVAGNQEAGLASVGAGHVRPNYDVATAKVLVALDSDFLGSGANNVAHAAGFAAGRRPDDGQMNRLYAVEPLFTVTGASADNRYQVPASQVGEFAKALCNAVAGTSISVSDATPDFQRWVDAIAADMTANNGRSLAFAGEGQPAWVHALVAKINDARGSDCVSYVPSATPPGGSLEELAAAVTAGSVDTIVILGGNPVYATGASVDVSAMLEAAETTIHVGFHYDETGRACSTHLPEAHALESWGDLQSIDGQTAIVQPVIEPLYASTTAIDVVGHMVGASGTTLELVQAYWQTQAGGAMFGANWRRWLHEGVTDVSVAAARPGFSWSSLGGDSGPMPTASSIEVTFTADSKVYDGRYSNNSWLQELPDPISKLTWDNAALMNPLTARELGISFGHSAEPTDGDRYDEDFNIPSTLRGDLNTQMVTVTVDGRSLDIPAFVVPGVAENTVAISLGYGREWGSVSNGVGANAYTIAAGGAGYASGASVVQAGGSYQLATTQDHGSMEGRPLIREATSEEYAANPHFATQTIFEGGPELMPADALHSLWEPPNVRDGQQWGMTIDLTSCIGCNACTAACNAENNISVVGKERVLEGREMHWIRLDRYFSGDPSAPDVHMQPVGCLHCENAPCEQVCPVGATVHGPEGTNDMAYNRCIGTRYCANNCPYKVRRFNFFNFSLENDDRNPLLRMQKNADVTVRFRGVMEKCSYCVQRINGAKIDAKVNDPHAHVADGAIVTACEQACPTGAIIFGDINDPSTRVSRAKALDRDYSLLSWVNSHPRTTYLARITNPNPELS